MGGTDVSGLVATVMKISQLYSNISSRGLLIRLMVVHILGTIFAYKVYIKLSSLGDGYLPESFTGWYYDGVFSATTLVLGIYHYLDVIFPGVLAPMVLGLVVAILTWHAFRDVYTQINPKLFWACNLFPLFLVWSGTSSKEQIFIICGIVVIDFAAKRLFTGYRLKPINLIFVFISLWYMYLSKPNYFVIYFTIFLTSLFAPFLRKIIINRFSVGVWVLTFILVIMQVALVISIDAKFLSEDVIGFMKHVEYAFLSYEGGSNRTNIQWNDISDFMYNSLWGIPQGFIGPTLFEAISKPIQFPVFLEGVVYFFILCYLFVSLFKLSGASNILRVHILPYIFVALVIVFISYPYLIFNAGSALRYKQNMHPILIFYPLLILAYARANNLMKINIKKDAK
ncbi:hypothetical protein OAK33_05995 [Candidatus Thioglobus sp.]|nr:hypothetical protein [Candidatus Thioglobus sp.]